MLMGANHNFRHSCTNYYTYIYVYKQNNNIDHNMSLHRARIACVRAVLKRMVLKHLLGSYSSLTQAANFKTGANTVCSLTKRAYTHSSSSSCSSSCSSSPSSEVSPSSGFCSCLYAMQRYATLCMAALRSSSVS